MGAQHFADFAFVPTKQFRAPDGHLASQVVVATAANSTAEKGVTQDLLIFSMGGGQILKQSTNLTCTDALVPSTNPEEFRVFVLCGFEAQLFSFSLV